MAARAQPPRDGKKTKPPPQSDEPPTEAEGRDLESLIGTIRGHVLRALGRPIRSDLVRVRPLWGDFYRVNIFVGEDPGCVTVVDSYFVETDGQGNIVESTPPLPHKG